MSNTSREPDRSRLRPGDHDAPAPVLELLGDFAAGVCTDGVCAVPDGEAGLDELEETDQPSR